MGRSSSDPRDALADLLGCVKSTFKKYDRTARRKAWDALQQGKGHEKVKKLINNPDQQINNSATFLRFKEWYYAQPPVS
jgi:hypothetical protein